MNELKTPAQWADETGNIIKKKDKKGRLLASWFSIQHSSASARFRWFTTGDPGDPSRDCPCTKTMTQGEYLAALEGKNQPVGSTVRDQSLIEKKGEK